MPIASVSSRHFRTSRSQLFPFTGSRRIRASLMRRLYFCVIVAVLDVPVLDTTILSARMVPSASVIGLAREDDLAQVLSRV